MKLISEEINNAEYIVEEKENDTKDYKIKGISFYKVILKIEMGQEFTLKIMLNKEVKRYNQEFINRKRDHLMS